ncbi:bursicon [Diachasma alloeum]|uniref:bursicon n=1 Tax=Diachasma alloeum TaxID=454923 RepID=UPI0010FB2BA2|nr:bursicon [Diachasma alloeum]
MYPTNWATFLYLVFSVLHWCLQREVEALVGVDECKMTKMLHVLKANGCLPRRIPSFICHGRCSSYIQVSGSRMWQMERSCMCCQESGEREATVSLFCPKEKRKFRKWIRNRDNKGDLSRQCKRFDQRL